MESADFCLYDMMHNTNNTASPLPEIEYSDPSTQANIVHTLMENDTPIDPERDLFRHHRRLVEWVTALNGYIHPDVRVAHSADKGFHMVVASGKQIRAETRIVSCPMGATISVLNALDIAPFYSHGTKFPQAFLNNNISRPEMIQTFFLMEQYARGDDSWWAPYIKTLPSIPDVNDMQFESAEDAAWLEGTNLKAGFVTQTSKWQDLYTKGLRSLKVFGWARALNGTYTWELYRWAATMFGSRSFTSSVLDDTLPADQVRMSGRNGVPKSPPHVKNLFIEKFSVLLPMLDILNHWPVTPVEWQARSTFVGMQVLENYESCQELCNNYGPKDNEGLLLSYGFVIPNNYFDHVVIALKAPPGSPLATTRGWDRDERSHPEFKSFLLGPDHPSATAPWLESMPFSYDLLDSISVLCANDRELQTMFMAEKTLMSTSLGQHKSFADYRNVLASLSQLLRDCRARAERLRLTYPTNLQPQSAKQQAAKIYRDSQYSVFQTACVISEHVLVRACTGRTPDSQQTNVQVQRALGSHAYLTKPGELLTVFEMLEMLPEPQAASWHDKMQKIEGWLRKDRATSPLTDAPVMRAESENQNHMAASSRADITIIKMGFTVLLSTAYYEYERGTKLPSRLRQWLDQLSHWYPPSDDNWSFVPHEGPWAPGEEPPAALMLLLRANGNDPIWRPKMLCWGWNVMEEEGVALPADLVCMADSRESVEGEVAFRLYCKH